MKYFDDIKNYFSKNGILSRKFPLYEYRKSQVDMALAIYENLCETGHIFIEAPTGIGKSFAYLVPAIYFAKEYDMRAVISTHTINLQEQLINKDIPLIAETLPVEFKYSLLKGKSNYVCPRRLKKSWENSFSLFESEDRKTLDEIIEWASGTKDGTLTDLDIPVSMNLWSNICAEVGICSNKTCGPIEETTCFYQIAKHNSMNSDVIVLNHHLFFTLYQVSKSEDGGGFLFNNDIVIFDEAQTLEATAAEHIVPQVSREMIKFHINKLYNSKSKKGFILNFPYLDTIPIIEGFKELNEFFFKEIKDLFFNSNENNSEKLAIRVYEPDIIENRLKFVTDELITKLKTFKPLCKNELQENELSDFVNKFNSFKIIINDFIKQSYQNGSYVYWVERTSLKPDSNVILCVSPVDLSEYFRKYIFTENRSTVLTSATLSIKNNFDYYKTRLGAEIATDLKLPSSFNFYEQVQLFIPKNIPIPSKTNSEKYISVLSEWLLFFIKKSKGKALVLFTNSRLMKSVSSLIKLDIEDYGIKVLVQGEGVSRFNLLNEFKENIDSVLFGLESFWLGVDVPGEALSSLIITRLPFQVPDHPLIQARLEWIDENGGNSFMDYSLPEAIFKFRQGVGRLIRHKTDIGTIVILDSRILKKSYGKHFLSSIEECPLKILDDDELHLI